MNRKDAEQYVSYAVDDNEIPRQVTELARHPNAVLVGWQCGFEPLFVAVWNDFNLPIYQGDAIDIATRYLESIHWFAGEPTDPNYVIGGT